MRRHHPNPHSTLSISHEVYLQLLAASGQTGFEKEDWEIAAAAINDWVRQHSPDAIAMPTATGYQWKQLFLPNGTLLRTIFNGKNHHCLVEGDQILYQGRAMSPRSFVNAIGGIRRNAWKSLWILLPDTTTWKLADSLRTKKRPGRARKALPRMGPQQDSPSSVPDQGNGPARQARAARPPDRPGLSEKEKMQGVGRPPNQLGESHPAGGAHLHDGRLSGGGERRAGSGSERRRDDEEAMTVLMRKALLAFSRSFDLTHHEAIETLRHC